MSALALDLDGPAAPPRDNGELVFAAPWESRAFGMAAALVDGGAFSWDGFREHLVVRIEHAPEPFSYYRCWLEALEDVLVTTGRLGDDDVGALAAALADRPAGHDHDHGDHSH